MVCDSRVDSIEIMKPADVEFGAAHQEVFQHTDIHAGFYSSIVRLLTDKYNKFTGHKLQYMAWTGQSVDDNGRAIILFNPTTSELQSFLVKTNSGRVRVVKNSVWDTADVFVFFDSKQATGAIARSYREDDRKNARRWRAMLGNKVDDVWEFK